MNIIITDGKDHDFIDLCRELDEFIDELEGGEYKRGPYVALNSLENIHDVFLAYDGDTPVGCTSYKYYSEGVAEVKRVYVKDEYRGKGAARVLMYALEEHARNKGYNKLILETSEYLTSAMKLYNELGYKIIDNYGPYKDLKESVCMEKHI